MEDQPSWEYPVGSQMLGKLPTWHCSFPGSQGTFTLFCLSFSCPHPFYMVEAWTLMLMGFFRTHSSCSFVL